MNLSTQFHPVISEFDHPAAKRREARRFRPFTQVIDLQCVDVAERGGIVPVSNGAADVSSESYDFQGAVTLAPSLGRMIDAVA